MTDLTHPATYTTWTDVPGWMNEREGAKLARLAKAVAPGIVVEVGTWCGRSACALALAVRPLGGKVISIDSYKDESQAAAEAIRTDPTLTPRTAKAIALEAADQLDVYDVLDYWHCDSLGRGADYRLHILHNKKVGLLHLDGHHEHDQVMSELVAYTPLLAPVAAVALHDYTFEPYGIQEAAEAVLPSIGFSFLHPIDGLGVWVRGAQ